MAILMIGIVRLINAICDRLLDGFDAFIIIEGRRGLGKSTFGIHILRKVKFEMQRRKVNGYKFVMKKDLLYTKKHVLRFFHKRKHSGMADEMINVSFNRDFYNEDQKDLIKMINMNRDHNNLFIACVPRFKTLDSQIKNLASMRITVMRRGLAVIQTPNKSIYSPDIWDESFNEKIEREWLKSGLRFPKYSKLTTFRGMIIFPKLPAKLEELYQKIKDEKRNVIAEEQGLIEEDAPKKPFEVIYDKLISGEVKNYEVLHGMILAHDLDVQSTKAKIHRQLLKDKKNTSLMHYYYDHKKKKARDLKEMFKDEFV